MLIGYGRVSTLDQTASFEHQLSELKAAGCEKVYAEQVSGKSTDDRPELEAMLGFLRPGDAVFALSLDRLARDTKDLLTIKDRITKAGATLRVRGLVDTADASAELVLTVLAAVATWERKRMKERQKVGIAKARADGKYRGRSPTARRKEAQMHELLAQGRSLGEIARELRVGKTSVHRILRTPPPAQPAPASQP